MGPRLLTPEQPFHKFGLEGSEEEIPQNKEPAWASSLPHRGHKSQNKLDTYRWPGPENSCVSWLGLSRADLTYELRLLERQSHKKESALGSAYYVPGASVTTSSFLKREWQ